ncbi:MAG: hypothetical protein ACFFDM_00955 [Candidatus Thorarchaeota archaeon]
MKGFFSDKKNHPWDRLYKDIQTYWKKDYPNKKPKEILILLRDAIFGALEILSLSIALPNPTSEFLTLFTNEDSWKDGRRKVRNKCIELVEDLIKKKKTRYLIPSALKRDGFGFFIEDIEEVEFELFKKAKPMLKQDPKSKKKVQVLDLEQLEKCRLGSKFLREQMIMETQIEKKDPRVSVILEAYDHFLVEYEIDRSSAIPEPIQTEQVTLNGTPLPNDYDEKTAPSRRSMDKAVQSPLTDFIDEKEIKSTEKKKKASKPRKRRTKKK